MTEDSLRHRRREFLKTQKAKFENVVHHFKYSDMRTDYQKNHYHMVDHKRDKNLIVRYYDQISDKQ